MFNLAVLKRTITGLDVVAILATLCLLTGATFLSCRGLISTFTGKGRLKGLLYGWLADLVMARTDDEVVLAYVVSDVQEEGTLLGYEGVVANMTTNAEKEITSILLSTCETFYLRVTQSGVVRRKSARNEPIAQLYLDRSRIKNVAFERLRFE